MDELPILDRARLQLISRGDAALAAEFIDGLFEEAGGLIERLDALAGDDLAAASEIAHTIKGMATELGVLRLQAAAAALETETDPICWPQHRARVRSALGELRTLLGAG